jgi:hypothetical protein
MSIKNRHGDTRHYFKTYTNIFYLFFYNKIIKHDFKAIKQYKRGMMMHGWCSWSCICKLNSLDSIINRRTRGEPYTYWIRVDCFHLKVEMSGSYDFSKSNLSAAFTRPPNPISSSQRLKSSCRRPILP